MVMSPKDSCLCSSTANAAFSSVIGDKLRFNSELELSNIEREGLEAERIIDRDFDFDFGTAGGTFDWISESYSADCGLVCSDIPSFLHNTTPGIPTQ